MLRVAARIILCWTIVVSVGLGYAAEYDRWFGPDEKAEEQQLLFTGQKVDCTLTISEPMWRWWVCVDGVNELKIIRGVEFDITIQWIPLSECVPGDGSARYRYAEYVYSNYPAFEHIGFGDGPDYLHFFWKSANYWDVVLDEIPPCHLHPTSGGVSRRYCGESSTNALVWVVPDHEGTVTRHVHLRIAEPWRSGTDCEPIEAIPELKVRAEYVHTYDGDLPYIKWGGEIGIGISSGFPPAVSVGTTFKVGNNRAWIKHAPYEHGTISEQLLPDDGYFCQIGAKN